MVVTELLIHDDARYFDLIKFMFKKMKTQMSPNTFFCICFTVKDVVDVLNLSNEF